MLDFPFGEKLPMTVTQSNFVPLRFFKSLHDYLTGRGYTNPSASDWRSNVGSEYRNAEYEDEEGNVYRGTLPQRIKQWLRVNQTNISSSWIDTIMDQINCMLPQTNYIGVDVDVLYEFHNDVDWVHGNFADSGSCWWTYSSYSSGRLHMRQACQDGRAFVLRTYEPTNTHRGLGRCFVIPHEDNFVILNPYQSAREPYSFLSQLLAQYLSTVNDKEYYFRPVDHTNLHSGEIYLNTHGMLVTADKKISLKKYNVDIPDFARYVIGSNPEWEADRRSYIRR